jgi:hypothetical protein
MLKSSDRSSQPLMMLLLILITLINLVITLDYWPYRSFVGHLIFGSPVWLIPALAALALIAASLKSSPLSSKKRDIFGHILSGGLIIGLSVVLFEYREVPERIFDAPLLAQVALVLPIILTCFCAAVYLFRSLDIIDPIKAPWRAFDGFLIFILSLNALVLLFPEVNFIIGREAPAQLSQPLVKFKLGYSDVYATSANPLFDIPRLILYGLGLWSFSDQLITCFYGALAVTFVCSALATFGSRSLCYAAALGVISNKYFLIVTLSGMNVVTALTCCSAAIALLIRIYRGIFTSPPPSNKILLRDAALWGLFTTIMLYCYAGSRLPALALCSLSAIGIFLRLFTTRARLYLWITVAAVAFLAPATLFLAEYHANLTLLKSDFFNSVLPNIPEILPKRPAEVPADLLATTPDLPITIGHARVKFQLPNGQEEVRGVSWRRSIGEVLWVASFHFKQIFERYTWFAGGVVNWVTFTLGLAAILVNLRSMKDRTLFLASYLTLLTLLMAPFFLVASVGEWRRGASLIPIFYAMSGIGVYYLARTLFRKIIPEIVTVASCLILFSVSARGAALTLNNTKNLALGLSLRCMYNPIREILKDNTVMSGAKVYYTILPNDSCVKATVERINHSQKRDTAYTLPISSSTTFDKLVTSTPMGSFILINCGEYGGATIRTLCNEFTSDPRAKLIHQSIDGTNSLWGLLSN